MGIQRISNTVTIGVEVTVRSSEVKLALNEHNGRDNSLGVQFRGVFGLEGYTVGLINTQIRGPYKTSVGFLDFFLLQISG